MLNRQDKRLSCSSRYTLAPYIRIEITRPVYYLVEQDPVFLLEQPIVTENEEILAAPRKTGSFS